MGLAGIRCGVCGSDFGQSEGQCRQRQHPSGDHGPLLVKPTRCIPNADSSGLPLSQPVFAVRLSHQTSSWVLINGDLSGDW
jgi:hypothetical protein